MYELCLAIQYIGIFLLIAELAFVVSRNSSKAQVRIILVMVGMIINFVGYLFELTSTNKAEALRAVKLIYFGKALLTIAMFLFVMGYCKVRISPRIRHVLIVFHMIIVGLVFTCDKHSLYYSSIDFTEEGLFPHLVFGHGPFYMAFMFVLFGYFATIFYVSIRRFVTSKDRYVKSQVFVLILIDISCTIGYGLFLAGVTKGYDTTLPALLISSMLMCICLTKYNVLDMVAAAKEYAMDQFNDGMIVIDSEGDIVYMNQLSEDIKKKLGADSYYDYLDMFDEYLDGKRVLLVGDNAYSVSKNTLTIDEYVGGFVYIIIDVTDSYNYTERLQAAVTEKTRQVVSIQRSVISSFATMIEARDGITGMHIKNTSNYVRVLVNALRLDDRYTDIMTDDYCEMVIDAASLHDIGKISIPDNILCKNGKLTANEFEIIKKHPTEGAKIIELTLRDLEKDEYLAIARDMAYYHHERWDGKGYPKGLKQTEIPLAARIMALADVYDALRSVRTYKESFDVEKSCNIIRESSGSQFDADIAEVFLAHIDEVEAVREL